MRLSQAPPTLLSLFMVLLSNIDRVEAVPTPKELLEKLGFGSMELEQRDVACGVSGQYTCTGAEACYTNAAQVAYCSVPSDPVVTGGNDGYAVYTTTYTETDLVLRTSTYTSSWYSAAPTTSTYVPVATAVLCDTSQEQTSCGPICCAADQVCASSGSCAPRPSSSAAALTSWTYIVSTMATTTSTFSAPLRPTSGTATTSTSVTTTQTFIPATAASGTVLPIVSTSTSHGLSGGAIAGIVIGTIVGVILLLLICFCCIVKAGFDGLLALFGLGSRRNRRSRERVEVVEERYSRHGSGTAASRRDTHTGWFGAGGRPARVTENRKKKSSGFGGLGAVGAGLLGLAVVLGLKRRHDRKEMVERTDVSSSYYTDSYTGTSASKSSRS